MYSQYQEGLLLYNYGTVCDDYFSDNSGIAICKQMGFTSLVSWRSGTIWSSRQNRYSINLDDVRCTSPDWSSCTYSTSHTCGHYEDVFLACSRECFAGQYRRSSTCYDCWSNSYSAGGISTSCTSCPSGSTSSPGSSRCECPAGKYWSSGSCSNCSSGYYSSIGMESCVRCPSGSSSSSGASRCTCPSGKYWSEGTCLSLSTLSTCLPGQYNHWSGSCYNCTANRYSAGGLTTSCTYCPSGSTSSPGSSRCECPAGKYWNSGSCFNCSSRYYSSIGMESCVRCPSGSTSSSGSSRCTCPSGKYWSEGTCLSTLSTCLPGQYNHWSGNCYNCTANRYSAGGLTTSCTYCPSGSTSSPGSSRCECPAGKYWNSGSCSNCSSGYYSSIGMESCVRCPSGSRSSSGSSRCNCPSGKYWNEGTCLSTLLTCLPGQYHHRSGNCYNCTANRYSVGGLTTSCAYCPSGSTSSPGSSRCDCPAGKYWNS